MSGTVVKNQGLPPASVDEPPPPRDSARGAIIAGFAILLVFFGGFGAWAVTAPLNSAVVANAVVKVEGNRKSVQHPDGGTVTRLRVREGDHVNEGDILLTLDDTDARAQVQILAEQQVLLEAVQARLAAERDGLDAITFPPDLAARPEDPSVAAAIAGQIKEFRSRRDALDGQQAVLERRIAQIRADITGNQAQRAAYQQQLDSVVGEKASLAPLLAQNLIPKVRMLDLDRSEAGIRGQIAETDAAIARAGQTIGELDDQIAQLGKDRAATVASDLRDTHAKLLDLAPRLISARAALARTVVRAPYAGTVVGLDVFSVGAVIARGERILDIVPDATAMVVEAQVAVEDIADVHPGMTAEVHFTSYKQRVTPPIHGTVMEISADRLTDQRTGRAYYVAEVAVDHQELAATPEIRLYPGMPATVMVVTEERTALDYLVGPLSASFDRAFRQR
jgi:epimerase transport system membrane fusion protein